MKLHELHILYNHLTTTPSCVPSHIIALLYFPLVLLKGPNLFNYYNATVLKPSFINRELEEWICMNLSCTKPWSHLYWTPLGILIITSVPDVTNARVNKWITDHFAPFTLTDVKQIRVIILPFSAGCAIDCASRVIRQAFGKVLQRYCIVLKHV